MSIHWVLARHRTVLGQKRKRVTNLALKPIPIFIFASDFVFLVAMCRYRGNVCGCIVRSHRAAFFIGYTMGSAICPIAS